MVVEFRPLARSVVLDIGGQQPSVVCCGVGVGGRSAGIYDPGYCVARIDPADVEGILDESCQVVDEEQVKQRAHRASAEGAGVVVDLLRELLDHREPRQCSAFPVGSRAARQIVCVEVIQYYLSAPGRDTVQGLSRVGGW